MKAQLVLDLDGYPEYKDNLDGIYKIWDEEFSKYEDSPDKEFYKSRIDKAYNILKNNLYYDVKEFDGDLPILDEEFFSFIIKYYSIDEIVKLELAQFELIDFNKIIHNKDDILIRKGIICEYIKDFYGANRYYSLVNNIEVKKRGIRLQDKQNLMILDEDLENGNLDILNSFEKEQKNQNIPNFWNCCLDYKIEDKLTPEARMQHFRQFNWRLLAAEKGDPYSMYVVSIAYVRGYPIQENAKKAYYWCHKGHMNFEYNASFVEGMLLEEGYGCKRNVKKAVTCYLDAANHGILGACLRLSNIYREGKDNVSKDMDLANYYMDMLLKLSK